MRATFRTLSRAAVLTGALLAGDALAQPLERVEADVSTREIAIQSTFTGARIVVFGAVERFRIDGPAAADYDIAVVIEGPAEAVVARRKSRVMGIWLNTAARDFESVPGYYAILSTRPLAEMAGDEELDKFGIGFDSLAFVRHDPDEQPPAEDVAFRRAVVRVKQQEGLYLADPTGVAFVGTSLFRATVDLPATVPVGEYAAHIYLFRDRRLLGHHTSHFNLHKVGFERAVTVLAFDYPLIYGIVAVLIAVVSGLAASAAFRRD